MSASDAPTTPRSARRRLGLTDRAALVVVGLVAAVAGLCAVTVWAGFEGESRRQQMSGAREVTDRVVRYSIAPLLEGNIPRASSNASRMASRSEVARVAVHDPSGALIAQHGRGADPSEGVLARGALERRGAVHARRNTGELMLAEPIVAQGRVLGAAVVTIKPEGFRYNTFLALAPFFLLLACLGLVAAPYLAHLVRVALSPLDALTKFAETVAEKGTSQPIALRTGDEFETLANAFNHMIARLEASMRRIQQIAFVDPITQLPNQDRFQREVEFFILRAAQNRELGAVLVLELQRLSRLLHTLDPASSRELMRAIAERLTQAVRTVDRAVRQDASTDRPAVAARIGACDFAVLAPGVASPAEAVRFAQHLNSALNQPFDWRGHKLSLGAACGVALAPRDGADADAAIRHARMALTAANGLPARLKVFTQSLDREAVARLSLEREMRAALENNEFRAYFQPKVNLATGKIEGAEALARWVRPDQTIVSPGRFIPIAEESGLIVQLSEAIMREACWKAAAWARAGTPAKVAVNVSALQFRSDRFVEHVLRTLSHAGLPPHYLELEITESVALEDPDRALSLIEPLKAAGVRLAVDDFGCGHSNLGALSKLPFDVIKIDQQFVRGIERGEGQGIAIVEMILALARSLNMEVVAEGVERRDQYDFMEARGCHWVQGFLFGAAVPAADFSEMLRRQASDTENAA